MYEEPHRWDDLPASPQFRAQPAREPEFEGTVVEPPAVPAVSNVEPSEVEGPAPPGPSPVEGSEAEGSDVEPPVVNGVESPSDSLVASDYSAVERRDKRSLQEAMHCEERETVLRTLAAAGRITVTALAARLGMSQKKLSRHLHDLRVAGLIDRQPEGKFAWYEAIPERVQLQQQPGGLFSLKVRRGNVSLTFAVEPPVSDTKGSA